MRIGIRKPCMGISEVAATQNSLCSVYLMIKLSMCVIWNLEKFLTFQEKLVKYFSFPPFSFDFIIELEPQSNLEISPDGEFLISYKLYQTNSTVVVYYRARDVKSEIPIEEMMSAVAISSDSRTLIYSNDIDIKFIDIETKTETRVIENISEHQVENVLMSPNGNYIAVNTSDQSITLVDVKSEEIFIFKDIHESKRLV